ncbi:Hypothetical predicted protein [Cloeon dipterum]|uniref:C-type lectin domain-containing protein n=1 Tax=Cloeon dipterum TaxID=197152 RepID=A0A8S1E127_9INSE|nr:Hypothetical predicted protein [Cloeon dipterum]
MNSVICLCLLLALLFPSNCSPLYSDHDPSDTCHIEVEEVKKMVQTCGEKSSRNSYLNANIEQLLPEELLSKVQEMNIALRDAVREQGEFRKFMKTKLADLTTYLEGRKPVMRGDKKPAKCPPTISLPLKNLNFTESKEFCRKHGMHLASPKTLTDLSYLHEKAKELNPRSAWYLSGSDIGGEPGYFRWHDDSPIDEDLWGLNEPNNFGKGKQACAYINTSHSRSHLFDQNCTISWFFICEYPGKCN